MRLHSIRLRLIGLVLATVVPFTALIGFGLWAQWQNDKAAAIRRALIEARLLAAQVDDHIGNLTHLMEGLNRAVSPNPADTVKNDALLHQVRAELPDFVSNIMLFTLAGDNIGTSGETGASRPNAADRAYFRQVLAGEPLAVGEVARGRVSGEMVVGVARPVVDGSGRLRAVLAITTRLERFQDALRMDRLPPGSIVRIVNEKGIVIARNVDGSSWVGRDLSNVGNVAQHIAAKEASEVVVWPDQVERITGSSTAHRVPWLVSVGLPTDLAFAPVASRFGWSALFVVLTMIIASVIAWMLSGHIVRPLRQLGWDASVLAAGKLDHRTAIKAQDEVGVLADAFNQMAESLQRRHGEAARAADEERKAKETLAAVIDASPVAIVCSDLNRNITLWSHAAEQMFGCKAEEILGRPSNLAPPDKRAESQELYRRAVGGETFRDVQVQRVRKDGSLVDVRVAAAPLHNSDGSVRGAACIYEDITDRKQAEEQLRQLAHYDQLTGLPNRITLQKELDRLLTWADSDGSIAVALFDLDGFKDVNDTLGHSTGDRLLIEVGRRLSQVAAEHNGVDPVCRLGGDEFVVVARCESQDAVAGIVDAMLKRLSEPFEVNDHVLHLGGSAGIALAPWDGANVDELLANADLALYQAKADGGRVHRFFLPALRAQAQARRGLDLELRRAFAENEFVLYFQPQVRLADNAIVGAEALLRWRHPARGILAPAAFIETLAASPIAPEVGRWIINAACGQAAAWRANGLPLNRIGVNLFPAQASDEALVDIVGDALSKTGLPAEALELEITENVALDHEDATLPIRKLRERGVKLAFDDFGTGYASLSYLTRYPLSRIKIDRNFVAKLTDDAEDAAIVRSLILMAHSLDLEVIAEGVETPAQEAFLLKEKCEEAQGYLYAKPLPATEFEVYLKACWIAGEMDEASDQAVTEGGSARRRRTRASARRRLRRA